MGQDAVTGLVAFTNFPQTTVSNGGTDAPAQGTSEQWTVSSSVTFPVASVSSTPPVSFAVADTAATSEVIQVTAVTSNVWGVTRGAESTTPVTHASNFTVQQVVSAGALTNFQQVTNNGNNGGTVTSTLSTSPITLATYTPPASDIPAAGVVYDINAFGTIHNVTTNAFTIVTAWNGTSLATANSGTVGGTLGTNSIGTFWFEGRVHCFGATTMVSGFNFQAANSSATHTISTMVGASSAPVTVSGTAGPLTVVATSSAYTIVSSGFLIHRIS
jgi:hypothetical protein